jgi:predicted signal transduction protein with EAL and GGDEF domain
VVEGSWSIQSRLAGHRISVEITDSAIAIPIAELFNSVNNVPQLSVEPNFDMAATLPLASAALAVSQA